MIYNDSKNHASGGCSSDGSPRQTAGSVEKVCPYVYGRLANVGIGKYSNWTLVSRAGSSTDRAVDPFLLR